MVPVTSIECTAACVSPGILGVQQRYIKTLYLRARHLLNPTCAGCCNEGLYLPVKSLPVRVLLALTVSHVTLHVHQWNPVGDRARVRVCVTVPGCAFHQQLLAGRIPGRLVDGPTAGDSGRDRHEAVVNSREQRPSTREEMRTADSDHQRHN
jgi:hypothetical protein